MHCWWDLPGSAPLLHRAEQNALLGYFMQAQVPAASGKSCLLVPEKSSLLIQTSLTSPKFEKRLPKLPFLFDPFFFAAPLTPGHPASTPSPYTSLPLRFYCQDASLTPSTSIYLTSTLGSTLIYLSPNYYVPLSYKYVKNNMFHYQKVYF